MSLKLPQKVVAAAVLCIPFFMVGCSNSDSDSNKKVGIFIDAPVKGLEYLSTPSGLTGVTNEKGEYGYEEGDRVTFLVQGINLGETDASPEVPVTNLENFVLVARILQTLDADSNPDLIDISKIKLPEAIKANLSKVLTGDETVSLESVLSDENLLEIESFSSSGDDELELVDSVVTETQAIEHITVTSKIVVDFTSADLSGKAFYVIDKEDQQLSTLYFFEGGTGHVFDQSSSGSGSPSSDSFSWSINEDGRLVIVSSRDTVKVTLHSIDGDRYNTTTVESDQPDSTFLVTLNRVKPLSTADLSNKILKRLNSSQCSARTIEFSEDGSTGTVKSICGDASEYHESTITSSDVVGLDNVIAWSGEDGDGIWTAHLSLISGDFEVGSQASFSLTSEFGRADVDAKTDNYEVVTEAVQAPVIPSGGFAFEDISGQAYTNGSESKVLVFFDDMTGTESIVGDDASDEDFGWSVDDGLLKIDYPDADDDVSVKLTSVSSVAHAVTITSAAGDDSVDTFNKVLPLTPEDLNDKILALINPAATAKCSERTIKFSTVDGVMTADMKERCSGKYYEFSGFVVSVDSNGLENVIELALPGSGEGVAYIALVDGNLETSAPVKLGSIFYKSDNELKAVLIETYELVEDELMAPVSGLAFSISDLAKQVYVSIKDTAVLSFGTDGRGTDYNDGDGDGVPYSNGFSWSVDEGRMIIAFDDPSEGSVTVEATSIDGNIYNVKAGVDKDNLTSSNIFHKAKPLSIAELNNKIIALDMSGDDACSEMTFAFTQTNAHLAEVCTDLDTGFGSTVFNLAASDDLDNVLVMTRTDEDDDAVEISIALIDGDIDTVGKVVFISKKNGDIRNVVVHAIMVVDEEASLPDSAAEAPTVAGTPVLDQDGSPKSITVKFSEDMRTDNYHTTGEYMPSKSYWFDNRTFVVEFDSYTAGGTITFETDGFKSVAGKLMDEAYTFTFPE